MPSLSGIFENISHYFDCAPESICIFDIETTGLSRESDRIYLCGFVCYENGVARAVQYLSEAPGDEGLLLSSSAAFLKSRVQAHPRAHILTFNGESFDLPFTLFRFRKHGVDFSFDSFESVDLYRLLRPFRKIFRLDSMSQKSLERFTGIFRHDPYNGGELIKIYLSYESGHSPEYEQLLLEHNFEDICNLVRLIPLSSYHFFITRRSSTLLDAVSSEDFLDIRLSSPHGFPVPLEFELSGVLYSLSGSGIHVRIPVTRTELFHYLPDYKNYYYLPSDGQIIHKSLACYVDSSRKKRCTRRDCRVKRRSRFIPAPPVHEDASATLSLPLYRADYSSKENFIELTDELLNDRDFLSDYSMSFLALSAKSPRPAVVTPQKRHDGGLLRTPTDSYR